MVLVIDNYDSFTYNLVQYLAELGAEVQVFRNDRITVEGIRRLRPQALVISPGPCTPDEAGISVATVLELGAEIPILGVCLGHQSIGRAFGGRVVHAELVMHGKTSLIQHDAGGVFEGLESPIEATRYHSLVVSRQGLPECLEETAWTTKADGSRHEIMGLRHRELPIEGVQFHPESILTPAGKTILGNFLAQCASIG
jgi:anthranilate synthase component 2